MLLLSIYIVNMQCLNSISCQHFVDIKMTQNKILSTNTFRFDVGFSF